MTRVALLWALCVGSAHAGAGVEALLAARTFSVEEPVVHDWSAERSLVSHGTVVVVQVDPALVRPRQTAMPVLYVGAVPAAVANTGYPSGVVVGWVPGVVDLAVVPVYFGQADLPERIDAQVGQEQLDDALARGDAPFPAAQVAHAWDLGGDPLQARGEGALVHALADLIERYAPGEDERVARYRRVPVSP